MSYPKCVTFIVHAPATRVGIVVGPGGATVNDIRRIYQVQINIPSQRRSKYKPSVDPQSTKVDGNQVVTVPIKISGNRNQAQDVVNVIKTLIASVHHPSPVEKHRAVIDIPQEYHAGLIGQQGKYAKRIEKRYGVRITFGPLPEDQPYEGSNRAVLSTGVPSVSIEGSLAGVEKARDELVECYRYIQVKRSDVPAIKPPLVWVSKNAVGGIIGREDKIIESIQQETNTLVCIRMDGGSTLDAATASPIGEPSSVAIATGRVQGIEAEIDREIMDEMTMPPKHYRYLVEPGGQLKAMVLRAGHYRESEY